MLPSRWVKGGREKFVVGLLFQLSTLSSIPATFTGGPSSSVWVIASRYDLLRYACALLGQFDVSLSSFDQTNDTLPSLPSLFVLVLSRLNLYRL